MRRLVVVAVWLAAIAAIVAAIGMRVRAKRLADPVQTVFAHVRELPPEFARIATVIGRGAGSVQVEIRASQKWVRTFAERNGFVPVDGALAGLAVDRWMLHEGKRKDAVLHLLLPLDGQPALLTIVE